MNHKLYEKLPNVLNLQLNFSDIQYMAINMDVPKRMYMLNNMMWIVKFTENKSSLQY